MCGDVDGADVAHDGGASDVYKDVLAGAVDAAPGDSMCRDICTLEGAGCLMKHAEVCLPQGAKCAQVINLCA